MDTLINIALISPSQSATSETFIRRHKDSFNDNCILYYGGEMPHFCEAEGEILGSDLSYYIQNISNRLLRTKIDLHEQALIRSFKRQNIHVCYAEYGTTGLAVMNACKVLNIPLIVNFHGFDISIFDVVEKHSDSYTRMFMSAHTIIGVSKYMCNKLKKLGCPPEKLIHLPCFPDPYFFDINADLNSSKLLSVGRFVDKKAPYLTLLAFSKVVNEIPDAELVLVGDGPLIDVCKNLRDVLNIPNVHILGVLPHEQVKKLFLDCGIFLQHSITANNGDQEGTPVSVMEASAAGIPVVSTFHAGIPDVVEDQKMGYLVDERDVDSMAEKIIYLLSHRQEMISMGKYAKEHMTSNYSDQIYQQKLNTIIHNCCK